MQLVMTPEVWGAILSLLTWFTAFPRCVHQPAHCHCSFLYLLVSVLLWILSPLLSPCLFPTPSGPFSLIPLMTIHIHINITAVMSISGCMWMLPWETDACLQIREINSILTLIMPSLIASSQILEALKLFLRQVTEDLLSLDSYLCTLILQ